MECIKCFGTNGRSRRSKGSQICLFERCKKRLAQEGSDGEGVQRASQPAQDGSEPTECYLVREIIGVSMSMSMTGGEARKGIESTDDKIMIPCSPAG